jgi:UDP-N-acetylglucosamine 2-epimerase
MTLRPNTERPETLSANFIIHFSATKFDQAWKKYQNNDVSWSNTLGDGTASKIIVETIKKNL